MNEITRVELEALNFTYGEDALAMLARDPLSISISISPHTGDVDTERYVNATLVLSTHPEYPTQLPTLHLQSPQGMSDKRIAGVLSQLHTVADSLAGEMMLGSLIEAAKDAMTDINQPEGHCVFCLEPLVPPGTVPSQDLLLRLPCYHCYHLPCFAEWWHWQQSSMLQKASQIKQDLQSAAPERLKEEHLIPDASGIFAIQCPICRLLIPALDAHQADAIAQHVPSPQQHQQPAALDTKDFTAKELDKLLRQRQERARQFAKQQQQGGIVSGRYGTSVPAVNPSDQTSHTEHMGQATQQQAQDGSSSQATETAEQAAPRRNQAQSQHRSRAQGREAAIPITTSTAPPQQRKRAQDRAHGTEAAVPATTNTASLQQRDTNKNNDAVMPTTTNTAPVRGRGRQPQHGQGSSGRGHRKNSKVG